MSHIKVLRIIARLNIGGPAIHTVLLTAGLDKNRFCSLLVSGSVSSGEGDMGYYAAQKGVSPIFIPQLRRELNPFYDLISLIKILKIIIIERPDIIHTHTAKAGTLGRSAGIIYNLIRRLLRHAFGVARNDAIKIIHTFHGHIFEGYFNSFAAKAFIIIEKILAHFTDKIITVSESVRRELISMGICKADKIDVIPLGLELDEFCGAPRNDQHNTLAHSQFRIGIVGRLAPIKNHRLFLEAADRLRRSLAGEAAPFKLKFIIVGDGEMKGELEEYSRRLNLDRYVEFLGWQKDLSMVYAALDIACLTSLNEGTPVSLIEAMASGKAIVATEVGGVTDLLGEEVKPRKGREGDFTIRQRGITAKSKDANGFARALKFVLENKGVKEGLSLCAREYVRDRFRKERLLRDIEGLYLKTVKI